MLIFNNVTIRKAGYRDVEALKRIGEQTFQETFGGFTSTYNMKKYLADSFNFQKLSSEIQNTSNSYFFAEFKKEIIGYLKINRDQTRSNLGITDGMELERIYVKSQYHGNKIGQKLLNKAIEIVRTENYSWLWLGVWENNRNAIGFYRSNGFDEFSKYIFMLGDEEQTDILMKLKIQNNSNDPKIKI